MILHISTTADFYPMISRSKMYSIWRAYQSNQRYWAKFFRAEFGEVLFTEFWLSIGEMYEFSTDD